MQGDERKIITSINQKKLDGYKYIYDNYYNSLCSFSTRFTIQKKYAEDIVQDVILRLWKNDSKFNTFEALKAYLYTAVKNSSLNALRNKSNKSKIEISEQEFQSLGMEDKSILAVIIEEEYYRQIHLAIDKLTTERKKVILYSMEGLSNKEIAKKTGVSVNTIKTLKLKAYRFLREELKQQCLSFKPVNRTY